ncbi:MAG: DUF2894 domain-containing protein [Rubrivivax sp.]|nr:DUF2894 domain-containing protein [Rubrivivax sp.]
MNEAAFVQAVRARRIDALARRAAGHEGAARQLLEARLQALRAAGAHAAAEAQPAGAHPATPLGGLLDHIAQCTATPQATRPELRSVSRHRGTWSRLSVEQRVHQALAQVPAQAGPLNTQRLVHEALRTLRELSPEYLHRLVAQVETLLWLEQAAQGAPAARAPAATRRSTRTTARAPGAA